MKKYASINIKLSEIKEELVTEIKAFLQKKNLTEIVFQAPIVYNKLDNEYELIVGINIEVMKLVVEDGVDTWDIEFDDASLAVLYTILEQLEEEAYKPFVN